MDERTRMDPEMKQIVSFWQNQGNLIRSLEDSMNVLQEWLTIYNGSKGVLQQKQLCSNLDALAVNALLVHMQSIKESSANCKANDLDPLFTEYLTEPVSESEDGAGNANDGGTGNFGRLFSFDQSEEQPEDDEEGERALKRIRSGGNKGFRFF